MPKLTRLRHSLRKAAKWGGLTATVLLCVIWVGSCWWKFYWLSRHGVMFATSQGVLLAAVMADDPLLRPRTSTVTFDGPGRPTRGAVPRMRLWHWKLRTVKGLCIIEFPTWFPLLLSAGVTAFAWRSNLLARRRARIGKCIACGYALDGLPPGAPCPECGAARTDAITQTEPADAP